MATNKDGKLVLRNGNSSITLDNGSYLRDSWKAVTEKFDVYESRHLFDILEAALEQGKRLGRAEVTTELKSLEKSFGKQINAIEKGTFHKASKKHKKKLHS